MLSIICGVVLIGLSVSGFWHLLPRNGKEHPLVENTAVGSTVAITIMCFLTIGVALFISRLGTARDFLTVNIFKGRKSGSACRPPNVDSCFHRTKLLFFSHLL
jgi:hypothetical protein